MISEPPLANQNFLIDDRFRPEKMIAIYPTITCFYYHELR